MPARLIVVPDIFRNRASVEMAFPGIRLNRAALERTMPVGLNDEQIEMWFGEPTVESYFGDRANDFIQVWMERNGEIFEVGDIVERTFSPGGREQVPLRTEYAVYTDGFLYPLDITNNEGQYFLPLREELAVPNFPPLHWANIDKIAPSVFLHFNDDSSLVTRNVYTVKDGNSGNFRYIFPFSNERGGAFYVVGHQLFPFIDNEFTTSGAQTFLSRIKNGLRLRRDDYDPTRGFFSRLATGLSPLAEASLPSGLEPSDVLFV